MTWYRVASLSDVPMGEIKRVFVEAEPVIICHTASGLYALADRCSHMDLPLSDGLLKEDKIICIHHGAMFCLKTGEACSAPAYEPVPTYPLKVENDQIWVEAE